MAAVAAGAFALAMVRFSGAAEEGCAQRLPEDPSYRVQWSQQPSTDLTRYRLSITREGRPVTEAEVCLNSYMKGMSAMAVTGRGREVAPGTYEVSVTFEMGGRWPARVLIAERARPVVAVPVLLEVREAPVPTTSPNF